MERYELLFKQDHKFINLIDLGEVGLEWTDHALYRAYHREVPLFNRLRITGDMIYCIEQNRRTKKVRQIIITVGGNSLVLVPTGSLDKTGVLKVVTCYKYKGKQVA